PNTYNGQAQPNIGTMLGIPNYAGGNPGSTGANQFLTGNFGPQQSSQSPGFQPINLDYGQNQQSPNPHMEGGGLPGITGPHIYAGNSQSIGQSGGPIGQGQTTSMSQVENALAAGRGQMGGRVLLPRHEIHDQRAEARQNGQTLAQLLGVNNAR